MGIDNQQKLMAELTLALLYLSSWEEERGVTRSWKAHDFDILDHLKSEGLISFSYSSKMLNITESGMEQGEILVKKLSGLL